jgi:hypothetical protein
MGQTNPEVLWLSPVGAIDARTNLGMRPKTRSDHKHGLVMAQKQEK